MSPPIYSDTPIDLHMHNESAMKQLKGGKILMSRIVIADFDGVIADHTEHIKIAQDRARAFVGEQDREKSPEHIFL